MSTCSTKTPSTLCWKKEWDTKEYKGACIVHCDVYAKKYMLYAVAVKIQACSLYQFEIVSEIFTKLKVTELTKSCQDDMKVM